MRSHTRTHTHTLFTEKLVVNLTSRTCSCNMWTLVLIPCRHVVSTIQQNREKPKDYVHDYYHRETCAKCYSHTMSPINGEDRWSKDIIDPILSRIYKVGPRCPKKIKKKVR